MLSRQKGIEDEDENDDEDDRTPALFPRRVWTAVGTGCNPGG
jgi:hypothetical protein